MVVADEDGRLDAVDAPEAQPRQVGVVALVAAVVLVLDQASKSWVASALSDGHMIELIGSLRLRLAHNPGAAFSIGSRNNLGPLIAVLVVVVVVVLVMSGTTVRNRIGAIAVGLIAGGAVGNLVDRIFRSGSGFLGGHVVDWIDLQWWPTFNIADAAVCVGAVVLVLSLWRNPPPAR